MRKICFLMITALVLAGAALAQTGTWALCPPQATLNSVAVQQPINADGTSMFKSNGNGVIPVKFTLSTAPGPVVFQSLTTGGYAYSYLNFAPNPALTFSQITDLQASYDFTIGNCHGGALRWSIATAKGHVNIYYGAAPNFTDCSGTNSQSGTNMIGLSDLRYDTSQIPGGMWYDTYAHALQLVGDEPAQVSLVLDAYWAGGDQALTLASATVNSNTWTPSPSGASTPTCALPPAAIKITKAAGTSSGTEEAPESIQPADDNSQFRVLDCKYMYNLATRSLAGAGTYKIEAVINGVPASGAATFSLK